MHILQFKTNYFLFQIKVCLLTVFFFYFLSLNRDLPSRPCVSVCRRQRRDESAMLKNVENLKKKVRKKSLDSLHAIGQGSPTGGNEFNWSTRSSLPPTLLPHLREGGGGKKRKEKKGSKPTREIGEEEEDGWVAVVLNDKNQTRSHQPSQQA